MQCIRKEDVVYLIPNGAEKWALFNLEEKIKEE